MFRFSVFRLIEQEIECWQRKRRRFPGSGLSDTQHVATFQKVRNGLGLNGSWGVITFGRDSFENLLVQIHVRKCGQELSFLARASQFDCPTRSIPIMGRDRERPA